MLVTKVSDLGLEHDAQRFASLVQRHGDRCRSSRARARTGASDANAEARISTPMEEAEEEEEEAREEAEEEDPAMVELRVMEHTNHARYGQVQGACMRMRHRTHGHSMLY